ncbi:MAG TPA: LuxR C-terminal-related transcriptional regulator [Methylibium sp.]|nr:LuxR C-terminal-related transcriptional regulator [Methylibium sp.]
MPNVSSRAAAALPQPAATAPSEVGAHKLFAPPVYPGAVRRGVILDRVLQDHSLRVTVLQGPAGHGKSTTLQQIKSAHEARGWRTVWLTFDDADNDPRRFESHLRALMQLLAGHGMQPGAVRGRAAPRDLADWLLDSLSAMTTHASIFLDEFQALRNDALLRFFRMLLPRLPAHVHVFIGSRALPEIGLATLMVNRLATVLRADDLRFTPGEVTQFFAESKELSVSAEEVGTIYRRTEGWPAGLQLFRLALASPEVRTSLVDLQDTGPRELAEYLTDNVVTLQLPRIQEFLFKTSLLRRLSAPLCAAVTGFDDAQAVLAQLERSGLFLRALDSENRWFKYHGLFSTFLADSLRRSAPQEVARVHADAALWYLDHDLPEEAIHHALASADCALAADTLTDWSSRLIASAELVTFERWYDRLPFEHIASRPVLAIRAAYALMFLRRRAKLRPLLALMEQFAGRGDIAATTNPDLCRAMAFVLVDDDVPAALEIIKRPGLLEHDASGFPAFEYGAASNVLSFGRLGGGDVEGMRKSLMLARAHFDRGAGSFVRGYTDAITGSHLLVQGRLQDALERFRAAGAQHEPIDTSVASAVRAACHIWAVYEANELDTAESLAARFQREIADAVTLDFISVALLSISRLHEARGRPAQAEEVLEELERIGHESQWKRVIGVADWERVRRALLAGQVDRATAIASRIPADPVPADPHWIHLVEDVEGEAFGRIRLAIAQGDHAQAAQRIARERTRQTGRVYRDIKLGVFEALLQHHKGSPNGAQRSLRRALQLARDGRFVRCFLDEGDVVVQMLREAYQLILQTSEHGAPADADPDREYIEQLLAASGTDLGRPRQRTHLADPLSEREKEMLQFLANGVSNKEIAARLFISENTVKFHLKNIYSKLGVGSRLQAINAARALRLVS